FRPLLSEMDGENATHGQAAGDDDVAVLLEQIVRLLDAGVPLLPRRAAQLLGRAAVACELAAVNTVPGTRQTLRDESELHGCAAQPVDQEDAHAPTLDEEAAVGNLLIGSALLHNCLACCLFFVFVSHCSCLPIDAHSKATGLGPFPRIHLPLPVARPEPGGHDRSLARPGCNAFVFCWKASVRREPATGSTASRAPPPQAGQL